MTSKPKKSKKPVCRKCKDTGIIPPSKAVLAAPGFVGKGGRVCTCAAGEIAHQSWQGLVSPGH